MRVARGVSRTVHLGLAVVGFGVLPTQTGFQDFGSLIGQQPAVSDRARDHLIASPFGTIHAALLTFPQPAGSWMPEVPEIRLASLNLNDADTTGSITARTVFGARDAEPARVFPVINRTLKGDRLVPSQRLAPEAPPEPQEGAELAPRDGASTFSLASAGATPVDLPPALDGNATIPEAETADAEAQATRIVAPAEDSIVPDTASLDDDDPPAIETARIYFGIEPMGGMLGTMQPWAHRRKRAARPSPAKARSRAKDSTRRARPSASASTSNRAPSPRNAWRMPSISRRAASPCAARWRSRRWS
jgi:hypothetical protein